MILFRTMQFAILLTSDSQICQTERKWADNGHVDFYRRYRRCFDLQRSLKIGSTAEHEDVVELGDVGFGDYGQQEDSKKNPAPSATTRLHKMDSSKSTLTPASTAQNAGVSQTSSASVKVKDKATVGPSIPPAKSVAASKVRAQPSRKRVLSEDMDESTSRAIGMCQMTQLEELFVSHPSST